MKIAITGSSGMVGTAVRARLTADGHRITRVVRDRERARRGGYAFWEPAAGEIDAPALEGHDAVIHLAGESLFGYWTEARKRRIERSRVDGTSLLARTVVGLEHGPDVLICASASGYYGDRREPVAEDAASGEGFLARVVREWEAAAEPARDAGIRVVHTRSGVLLSPKGGALRVMVPIFKLGLGGPVGDGSQPFPWITIDDEVGVFVHALETPALSGPVNVAAPNRTTMAEFCDALGDVLGRPTVLFLPSPIARLVAGDLADEMLLTGAPLDATRLRESGYVFRHPDVRPALRAVLGLER